MAGRGRGRGRGKGFSFNVENLGFGRGEALPANTLEPPPAYPKVEVKAVPLASGDHYDYLLALKQEYRANMKESIYYIKPDEKRKDIERYSDKYQAGQQATKQGCIVWSSLPKELQPRKRKRIAVASRSKKAKKSGATDVDIAKKLEELEKKEGSAVAEEEEAAAGGEEEEEEEESPKKKKAGDEEDDEAEIEEDLDEDELEDETDYAMTYFDNGENYGADEDDDLEDDGAIY